MSNKGYFKSIKRYADVREQIKRAVDTLADPIRETLSPKGRNVLFESANGEFQSTNDGVTIAKNINVRDPYENLIINMMKQASLKTNNEAGDGTSTSILLSQILIKEGFRLVDQGHNQMDVKHAFEKFGKTLVANLKKEAIKIKTDKDLFNIANISANNDPLIAADVVKVVKCAGLDGMVFIEANNKPETNIIEDNGFLVETGLFAPELRNMKDRFVAQYHNVPVLITDKRLYYPEEAETILKTVLMAGHKSVVIVARDFIGQSVNTFITNHTQGVCNVMLVKDPNVNEKDNDSLQDLATYLGGKLISEKNGSIVDNLTIADFVVATKVYADPVKTIILGKPVKKKAGDLAMLITALRGELEKKKEDKNLKRRLASLTNGMVTVKVGAATQLEQTEKIFRYEDAINATRAAMKDGYLVGGGIALKNAFKPKEHPAEFGKSFQRYCEANIRQIAENCGKSAESVLEVINASKNPNLGFNAMNGQFEDLLKVGVVDPYKVTEMAVLNSVSVAKEIISANTIIVNDIDENND